MAKKHLKVVKLRPERIQLSSRALLEKARKDPLDETVVIAYTVTGDLMIYNTPMSRERFNMMLDQTKLINLRNQEAANG